MLCIVLIFLLSSKCIILTKSPISDVKLEKNEDFEYVLQGNVFENTEESRTLLSLVPNEWVQSTYFNPTLVSLYPYIRDGKIIVKDQYLYAASSFGFHIVDISDPSKPTSVSYLGLSVGSSAIFMKGEYVFVTTFIGKDGTHIIDASDVQNPIVVSKITSDTPTHIFVEGEYVFIIDDSPEQLKIFDISTIEKPQLISQLDTTGDSLQHLYVVGNYVYITDTYLGLQIVEVSNKTKPMVISTTGTPGSPRGIIVSGDLAYICDGYKGLLILNVSDPTSPKLVSACQCGILVAYGMDISGDLAFIFDTDKTVKCLNISDPYNPFRIPPNLDPGDIWGHGIIVRNDVMYLSTGIPGLFIYDISNTNRTSFLPKLLSHEFYGDKSQKFAVSQQYLYITDGSGSEGGISVMSISDISKPRIIARIGDAEGGSAFSSFYDQDSGFIYVADLENGFKIVDVSDPYHPYLVGQFDLSTSLCDVYVQNEIAYITDFKKGLKIMDVKNKTHPVLIGSIDTMDDHSKYIVVEGNYAYIAQGISVAIINISDPTAPNLAGSCETYQTSDVKVLGNYAYIADSSDGLKVCDVSDPSKAKVIGSLNTYNAITVSITPSSTDDDSRMIILADGKKGVLLIDVGDPASPALVASFTSPSQGLPEGSKVVDVVAEENYIFAVLKDRGVVILRNEMKVEGKDPSFDSFCGETSVSIGARDGNFKNSEFFTSAFRISREGYCNQHGTCIPDRQCSCSEGYTGDYCSEWSCHSLDFKEVRRVCSGHGNCISPDKCSCQATWYGEECSSSLLYATVLAPGATVLGLSVVILLILCWYIICLLCCVGFGILVLCFGVCAVTLFKQTLGLRKFGRLRDFDLLLKEQEMDEDTSIAHLRIDKSLFEIPYEEISLKRVLGEGGSASVVYKAKWKGQTVAFKSFKTRTICQDQTGFDEFEREVHILGSVSHPGILRFLGCSLKVPRVGILMEFCVNGDLSVFLRRRKADCGIAYPIEEKMRMCFEIIGSMEYLHSRNIIHRDMKLENVLVDSSEHTKVMDFGLSTLVDRMSQVKTTKIGTSYYMAPEIVLNRRYNEKCDMFSFAIMMFMIITENYHPYGEEVTNIEMSVANNPMMRPQKNEMGEILPLKYRWVEDTVAKCWDHESKKRLSFVELSNLFSSKEQESREESTNGFDFESMCIVHSTTTTTKEEEEEEEGSTITTTTTEDDKEKLLLENQRLRSQVEELLRENESLKSEKDRDRSFFSRKSPPPPPVPDRKVVSKSYMHPRMRSLHPPMVPKRKPQGLTKSYLNEKN